MGRGQAKQKPAAAVAAPRAASYKVQIMAYGNWVSDWRSGYYALDIAEKRVEKLTEEGRMARIVDSTNQIYSDNEAALSSPQAVARLDQEIQAKDKEREQLIASRPKGGAPLFQRTALIQMRLLHEL